MTPTILAVSGWIRQVNYYHSKRLSEVRSLAVHPDYQEQRVAAKLVERCTERARELGIKELFAVTSRTSFFGRLGFATFRREKTAMFLELGGHTSAE